MRSISLNRLGGGALIVGPVLTLVFFLLQPGGVLVDMTYSIDYRGPIPVLTGNTTLVDVTAVLISLGLVMSVYGFHTLQNVTRDGGSGDAFSRLGFLLIVVGAFGWVMVQGLVPTYHPETLPIGRAGPAYETDSGITLISDVAFSLGILMFSLALSTRDDFNRRAALRIAAVSVVALVSFIIAASVPAQRDTMIVIGRMCYFPWVIWAVSVGVRLVKMDAAERIAGVGSDVKGWAARSYVSLPSPPPPELDRQEENLMRSISLDRLGGIALIVGPVLAIIVFLLQPGGALIDMTTDFQAPIPTLTVAHWIVTSILIPLGLGMMVYGFYAVQNVTRDSGGDALSRLGFLLIVAAAFGWVLVQRLVPVQYVDAVTRASTIRPQYEIAVGITLVSDVAFSLGILTFSLALSTRDDSNRAAALVIAAVSVVALVSFIIVPTVPAQADTMTMIGGICYFSWVIWAVLLGVGLIKRDAAEE